MYKLEVQGVKLPDIYVAENQADVDQLKDAGLPYISWANGKDKLLKLVFLPYLKKKFPAILWDKVLGIDTNAPKNIIVHVEGHEAPEEQEEFDEVEATGGDGRDEISDVAGERRQFNRSWAEGSTYETPLDQFVGSDFVVDIEVLEELNLLPKFLADIATNILRNLGDVQWRPGYNKKLGAPIGVCDAGEEMRNLLIIDVSASIPRGIAATMLSLADTLRSKCNADLIITGKYSRYWEQGDELPTPEKLRRMIPPAQESEQFNEIIRNNLRDRCYGNVIAFGDNDSPWIEMQTHPVLSTIKVHEVWSYHTGISYRCEKKEKELRCGYVNWCDVLCTPVHHSNTDWIRFMDTSYGED